MQAQINPNGFSISAHKSPRESQWFLHFCSRRRFYRHFLHASAIATDRLNRRRRTHYMEQMQHVQKLPRTRTLRNGMYWPYASKYISYSPQYGAYTHATFPTVALSICDPRLPHFGPYATQEEGRPLATRIENMERNMIFCPYPTRGQILAASRTELKAFKGTV